MREITKGRRAKMARRRGAETNTREVRGKKKRMAVAAETREVDTRRTREGKLRATDRGKRRDKIRVREGGAKRRNARETEKARNNGKSKRSRRRRASTSHRGRIGIFITFDAAVRGNPDKRDGNRGGREKRETRPNGEKRSIQIGGGTRAEGRQKRESQKR